MWCIGLTSILRRQVLFNYFIKDLLTLQITNLKKLDESEQSEFPEFKKSKKSMSEKYDDHICELISRNSISPLNVLDIGCGHGNHLHSVHKKFDSRCVGIDIKYSGSWNEYESRSVRFFKQDVDDVIKNINCDKPFDVIITMNTLRAEIREKSKNPYQAQWKYNYYEKFLTWCSKNCKYLITNNCQHKDFVNFNLVDNLSGEDILDCNLFKSKINEGDT